MIRRVQRFKEIGGTGEFNRRLSEVIEQLYRLKEDRRKAEEEEKKLKEIVSREGEVARLKEKKARRETKKWIRYEGKHSMEL